ncbi:phosphatase PAP2 family protein [Nocardia amamiensis]|uniref:Phosphatase PAP2 family protein n=1 Tax=Nocardia amamiensis TaxID=404578 RepID=A0ABS0CUK1_9NOCA|nr:phosphatase PAP2 family protein [Nocardia amamiensis]MBF6300210.1 phosphatase PAP2 family protein [Nocardia amamiensis]
MLAVRQTGRGNNAATVHAGVAATGVAATAAIPATLPADGGPSALDRAIADPVHAALDARPGVYEALVVPSNGYVLLPLLILACVWFARRGDLRRAATMLVVPELAVAINTWLLKPLWGRQWHDYLAYPSGHTVHLVAIGATFVLLTEPTHARRVVAAVATVAMPAAAVGMIGLGYHHATDILGGIAAAITMAISLCWAAGLLDRGKARGTATQTYAAAERAPRRGASDPVG